MNPQQAICFDRVGYFQKEITIQAPARGCHYEIYKQVPHISQFQQGIAHIFIKHTSASVSLNENCDPDVRIDMEEALNRIVPESWNRDVFKHTMEGDDDMPAHVKSSLVGASVSVPITNGRFQLGTWQGIYLFEHRNTGGYGNGHQRNLVVSIHGCLGHPFLFNLSISLAIRKAHIPLISIQYYDMKKPLEILYINASPHAQALTSVIGQEFLSQLTTGMVAKHPIRLAQVNVWDADQVPDFGPAEMDIHYRSLRGLVITPEDQVRIAPIRQLAQQVRQSNVVLLASPVWNFSVPFKLKQYLDAVVLPPQPRDQTTKEEAMTVNKKQLVVVTAAGGQLLTEQDFCAPMIRSCFQLIGYETMEHIALTNTSRIPRDEILDQAQVEITTVVERMLKAQDK